MMLSVARGYVRSRAVAEEVVQEAWLGVLKGLDRFEGRSSLKTWIMRILANIAILEAPARRVASRSRRLPPAMTSPPSTPTAFVMPTMASRATGERTHGTGAHFRTVRCSGKRLLAS